MPSRLSQFWQELKRRKVTRVITVYAAAAFVILELVDIIAEPLKLPEWFLTAVIIILCIGFIITVIVSWIYDIHPEGGIVKTEPAHKIKPEDIPKSSNSWKIASYVSFVVIVGLIVLNIIPRSGKKVILDKSIAVLPFINDSQEQENEHFINGIMDELLINLQTIKELRVPGRTSTEQYRSNPKSIPEIASEMNVAYIVEGSGQRYGDNIRLRVQLVEGATDRHIWADSYEEIISGPEDIFRIQSKIAQSIAAELQAVITPSEKELIEKVPTTSLTALDYFQQARNNHWDYRMNTRNKAALQRAEDLYHKTLEIDPTFAQAYNGLAQVYWNKHNSEEYLSESYLDSVLILTDNALSLDPDLSETYVVRGDYYRARNNVEQAIDEYNKALQLNPNDWEAYLGKAQLYVGIDNLEVLKNGYKASSLNKGERIAALLGNLSMLYSYLGFEKQCMKYAQQYLELTGDSVYYYFLIAGVVHSVEQIEILLKAHRLDTTRYTFQLAEAYLFLGNYEEALKYFRKISLERLAPTVGYHRFGLVYWHNGDKDLAEYCFDKEIEVSLAEIDLGRGWAERSYYSYLDLASVYAIRGEKERAIEYLRMFNQKKTFYLHIVSFMHTDPSFDNIRDEPEFQQITRDMEAKYQAEHERVREWLEENEML